MPRGLAAAPDGGLFIADALQRRVRCVRADGVITTAAGNGHRDYRGETGMRPQDTPLPGPFAVAVGPDGSLYIADNALDRVFRVGPDGQLVLGAGKGGNGYSNGDGGPAGAAQVSGFGGLAADAGGNVYIAQNANDQYIRRLGPDGFITRLKADKIDLKTACGVAAGSDGAVYVADADAEGNRVWRIEVDGKASVFAGTGKPGFSGDGGPATAAQLNGPNGVAVGPDGSVYISDVGNRRVRRVGLDGVIATVAGNGVEPLRIGAAPGDGGPAVDAPLLLGEPRGALPQYLTGLAVGPDGALFIAEAHAQRVRRVACPFGGLGEKEIVIPSGDGGERYVFDGDGRHLRTVDGKTNAVISQFTYDKEGRLKEVADAKGKLLSIERDSHGLPRALAAADGARTPLQVGEDGYLSRIGEAGESAVELEYAPGGLLTGWKGPSGAATYRYDAEGRLTNREGTGDPTGPGGEKRPAGTPNAPIPVP
jgi:YD repeat-containing protein